MQILDIDADADPNAVAERLLPSYEDRPFDYANETQPASAA